MSDLSLVILAGGLGRRFGGRKQLTPFGPAGEVLMDYALHDARGAGITRAVLVVAPGREAEFTARIVASWRGRLEVRLAVQRPDDLPPDARPVPARERPWGTGHAVWAARGLVNGPFLVVNADDYYGPDAYRAVAAALRDGAPDTFVLQGYDLRATLPPTGAYSRGRCEVGPDGWLVRITEHVALTRREAAARPGVASLNFWGFTPEVFTLLEDGFTTFLAAGADPAAREFFLPTAIQAGLEAGRCRVRVLPPVGGWCGVTAPDDVAAVRAHLAALHRAGRYPSEGLG